MRLLPCASWSTEYVLTEGAALEQEVVASGAAAPSREARVAKAIETWSTQLMDVGGRNNLLFFRDLRASTLDLGPARPPAIDSLLLGKPVRLSALFPAPEDRKDAIRRMRSIHGKAREHFEERGISTLYLACGLATWTNQRTASVPAAPILMRPAEIIPKGAAEDDFELALTGEMELNPVLLHMLETDYSRKIPQEALLDRLDGVVDTTWELNETYEWLNQEARQVPGFGVQARMVLGNFLYAKLPMVEDLKGATARLAAHDVVGAIVGDPAARDRLRTRYDAINVDIGVPNRIAPDDEFIVLDADSSQSLAINQVVAGRDLIIKGPPGTGKSQTIANLITSLLGRGQKVLFVAEKRAAIDAVFKRLEHVGLSDLLLDVHGGTATRREIAESLGKAMDAMGRAPLPVADSLSADLVASRTRLGAHAVAMHAIRDPWGISLFDAIEQLTELGGLARTDLRFRGATLGALTSERFAHDLIDVKEFLALEGLTAQRSSWAQAPIDSAAAARDAFERVETVRNDTLPAFRSLLERAARDGGRLVPVTRQQTDELVRDWVDSRSALDVFRPEIFEYEMAGLVTAMAPARGAITRLLGLVTSSDFRVARRELRSLAVDPAVSDKVLLDACVLTDTAQARWRAAGAITTPTLPPDLAEIVDRHTQLRSEITTISKLAGSPALAEAPDADLADSLDVLINDRLSLLRLPDLRRIGADLERDGLWALVEQARAANPPDTSLVERMRWAWLWSVIERCEFYDENLGRFDGSRQLAIAVQYAQLDHQHLDRTSRRLHRIVAEQSVRDRSTHRDEEAMLRHQASLKRRHLPLRQLFQKAPNALLAVKPCWAMSPLMVSQVLPSDRAYFDVVIFDEASQVTPADAIPSIMRAQRVVVAGDDRQLPPTSFFMTSQQEDETRTESETLDLDLTQGFESILDSLSSILPVTTLDWHYRSQDERLIAFSNQAFYDSRLVTFPGVSGRGSVSHVLVPFVPGAGQEDSAASEVREVVRLILQHATDHPNESLGVIAMGITHANRIEDALRVSLQGRRDLDAFFDEKQDERFFVKNLERVQGDERDAIILSVGYGKSDDGKMLYRFGPINYEGGERRLNVAVTRARRWMTVVSSFSAGDMDPERVSRKGPRLLREYLAYAEASGERLQQAGDTIAAPGLGSSIVSELEARGFKARARIGSSEHWIDLGVADPEGGDRYVLAVETDGHVYGSTATTRDRDRLRREQLERLGWAHHRIWALDWLHQQSKVVDAIVKRVESVLAGESPEPATRADRTWGPASVTGTQARGPKPPMGYYDKIDDISPSRLVALIDWLQSDGLLRTDEELITEAIPVLGFQRRGPRIDAALKRAVAESRARSPHG